MTALEELRSLIPPYKSGDDIGGLEDDILCEVSRIADHIEAEYIELPKDADGVTCNVGDYVECFAILGADARSDIRCRGNIQSMVLCLGNIWLLDVENGEETEDGNPVTEAWYPENVAHTEPPKPETQEKITIDALKCHQEYWDCGHRKNDCTDCPSFVMSANPSARTCTANQTLDLLRRQRALDGRAGIALDRKVLQR